MNVKNAASATPVSQKMEVAMARGKKPDMPVVTLGKTSAKKLWDNFEHIAWVRKTNKLSIRVAAATRDGFRFLVLREYYYNDTRAEWLPGRDGITITLKSPIYPDGKKNAPQMIEPISALMECLPEAIKMAETMELYDSSKAVFIKPTK